MEIPKRKINKVQKKTPWNRKKPIKINSEKILIVFIFLYSTYSHSPFYFIINELELELFYKKKLHLLFFKFGFK